MMALVLVACGSSEAEDPEEAVDGVEDDVSVAAEAAGPPAGGPAAAMAADPEADIVGDSIKIGLITVTEGAAFAAAGQRALQGAEYAVAEVNAAGGIGGVPIELIVKDTKGDVDTVANIVRELVDRENVLAILGPLTSSQCQIGCPLANELGTVTLSSAATPGLVEEAGPYAFSLVMPDTEHSKKSLRSVFDEDGSETAVLLLDESEEVSVFMSENFWPQLFEEAGIELVDVVTFTSGDLDFSAQATRISAEEPDIVGLAAGSSDAARFAIELRRQGVEAKLVGTGGLQSSGADFIDVGGEAVEGTTMAAQFNPNSEVPETRELLEAYLEGTGDEASLNGAYIYDSVYLLVDVIKHQGITNAADQLKDERRLIMEGIPSIAQDWVGLGGPTTINPEGTTDRPAQVAVIESGEMVMSVVE